jgi:hypothetical protein
VTCKRFLRDCELRHAFREGTEAPQRVHTGHQSALSRHGRDFIRVAMNVTPVVGNGTLRSCHCQS